MRSKVHVEITCEGPPDLAYEAVSGAALLSYLREKIAVFHAPRDVDVLGVSVRSAESPVIGETAERDDLRRTFNRLRADDRIPALQSLVKQLSVNELDALALGYAGKTDDEAEHARKRATKIRESFLASVRANTNLLASMTADERAFALRCRGVRQADHYARDVARALMVETWGAEAVDAALGGGS